MVQGEEKEKGHYLEFIKSRLVPTIVVSLMPMILVSSIILYQFYTSYQEKVHAHLQTLVKKHKLNIDTFLREKRADIRSLSDTFTFDQISDEDFLRARLDTLQQEYGHVFVDLGVINSQGSQVAYAGPFKLGKAQYSSADWFQEVIKNDYVISDVFLGLRGLPHFIIAVRQNNNGEDWILRATIDFASFNSLVENIRIGETGFAFILNMDHTDSLSQSCEHVYRLVSIVQRIGHILINPHIGRSHSIHNTLQLLYGKARLQCCAYL